MPLKRLIILHITDLHFGFERKKVRSPVSQKFLNELVPNNNDPKSIFLTKIGPLARTKKFDILAFTGDLGFNQNPEAKETTMVEGLDYLSTLQERLGIPRENVIIAPGNHDLDRDAPNNGEFAKIHDICKKKGFTLAGRETPASIVVNNIPIIAINTCLGGTEHAYHNLPEAFWMQLRELISQLGPLADKYDSEIPDTIKLQLMGMDIPAIGQLQSSNLESMLAVSHGNLAVLLGHHNILPTHVAVVRPYADVLDAGRLIFNLLGSEKRVLFLHGHTHCDTALTAKSPDLLKSGFVSCLGSSGLHALPGSVASASVIEILTDHKPDFLCAIVKRYLNRGINFIQDPSFYIWDEIIGPRKLDISLNLLESDKTLYFDEAVKKLEVQDPDQLVVELLKSRSTHQIELAGVEQEPSQWRITRNR